MHYASEIQHLSRFLEARGLRPKLCPGQSRERVHLSSLRMAT